MPEERLAPVVDLAQYRQRNEARHKILMVANRLRVRRGQYVRSLVWRREIQPPTLLTMRHINQAVAICRHWGLVPDEVLYAAGFRTLGRPAVEPATIRRAA